MRLSLLFILIIPFYLIQPADAQMNQLSQQDLSKVKVDELSDAKVRQIISEAESRGLSEQELETMALARGMSATEIQKLKSRIQKIKSTSLYKTQKAGKDKRTLNVQEGQADEDIFSAFTEEQREARVERSEILNRIYGYSLFNSEKLTFEPSLDIPTPPDYQLGTGDEVSINIWGASEASYQLTVSPEGYIRIPNLGPIYVNGLSMDKANGRILSQLTRIYSGIDPRDGSRPNTYAQVSLTAVRSIKVNILGEVNLPGTYTLPSLATVFNALYVSGGPSVNGSFRDIQVIRDNKVLTSLDIYDFLNTGIAENNIRLRDQDIIKVNPYETRIEVLGETKREGFFELKEDETLSKLVEYAGGFTNAAYRANIKVVRNTPKEKKVLDVSGAEFDEFTLQNGDQVTVEKILDRFENRVEIKGAVYRDGFYQLEKNPTVMSLIEKAGGLRGDAFMNRANIYRLREDLTLEVIAFDLRELVNGNREDISLKRDDLVRISSLFSLKEDFSVRIFGEVLSPGDYPYAHDMNLEDLIILAGGLKESAENARVEVARRINSDNTQENIAEIIEFPVNNDLSIPSEVDTFSLQPFDQVYVRKSPGYEAQITVNVNGEVKFPGTYALSSRNERLSTLIERAGGLTDFAYVNGAKIIRRAPLSRRDLLLKQRLAESDSIISEIDSAGNLTVGIDLAKILEKPGSDLDIVLQQNDILEIPRLSQTVKLSGEVLYASFSSYDKSMNFKNYIASAGGFTDDADKRRAFVIYPNGSADRTRSFLGFKNYPKIVPGSEIVVPEKPRKKGLSTQEVLALSSGVATLSLVIINLVNSLNN